MNLALTLCIQGGSRLIQNEDRCVLHKSAGNGHALPLAAGKPRAPLPQFRVQGLIAVQEDTHPRRLRSALDLLRRGIRLAQGNVITNAARKEQSLLADQCDLITQLAVGQVADVYSIYLHATLRGIVKARDEAREGRFTGTAGPHEANDLTGGNAQIHLL